MCAGSALARRLFRRADRDQSRRQFADARRAVRAHQRHHVRHRHGRRARHDQDGIGQYAGDLAAGVLTFFHSFLLFFGWRSPTPLDAAMLFGTGFVNAIGQWFWTKALHLAPAPAVTPFYYLMLVWALVIGFVVWGDVPSVSLLIGSAIVVATGLFLFLREARLQRRPA